MNTPFATHRQHRPRKSPPTAGVAPGLALLVLIALRSPAQFHAPNEVGTTVNGFQDNFDGATLRSSWVVRGAQVFTVGGGMLHIAPAAGDPNHLLYEVPGYHNSVQEVLARIRVTRFAGGAYARGGVGVGVDPATSQGINHTFRDGASEGQTGPHTALLDDFRAWGPGLGQTWRTNVWYWLRLRQEPNAASEGGSRDVFGKLWPADGASPEPAAWQITWDYTPARSTRTGYAGLMAGSSSGGSSDFSAFDVDYVLIKAPGLPSVVVAPTGFLELPAAITNQPQDLTVTELLPATFTVGAAGRPPPSYQWHRDGLPIPGATNAAHRIDSCRLTDDGARFQVVVNNVTGGVGRGQTSLVAVLRVRADTAPPALVSAQSLDLDFVQVGFSEPVEPASAIEPSRYSITGPGGPVTVLEATPDGPGTNVVLRVSPLVEGSTCTLLVNGVRDTSAAANAMANGTATFMARRPVVWITECLAENTVGLVDADGAHSDWIELQNRSPWAVDLAGWRLTDDPADLAKWTFPPTTLAPGAFLIVFASGKDRRIPGAELHTNFRLDAAGEYLALVRAGGTVAHELSYGPQRRDVAFGLAGNTNLFLPTPTPGGTNGPGVAGFVADTKFNPGRGFFTNGFSLSIITATAGAEIWFTTGGWTPAPREPASARPW